MSKKKKSAVELLSEAIIQDNEAPWSIPENWVWTKLKDVAEWGSGGTPKSSRLKYYGGEIPWLTIGDLNDDVVLESAKTITEEGLENSSAKLVPKGSLLIGMYGSIGKLGIAGFDCATNQAIAFTKRYKNNIHPNYLFYYLLGIRNKLLNLGKGGTQKNISQTVLKEVEIPIPPLTEQMRISEKVERLLNKIEESMHLIEEAGETFELRRAAILDKAFRGELTSNNSGAFSQEWNKKKLGNLCTIFSGKAFKKAEYADNGVKLAKIQNVTYRSALWEDVSYLPMEYIQKASNLVLEKGDILLALNRPITNNKLKVAMLKENDLPSILYQRIGCLRPNEEVDKDFLFLYLTSGRFYKEILNRLLGTDQPYINLPQLKEIEIPLPPLDEQQQIVEHVTDLIKLNEQSADILNTLNNIQSIKLSILSKAFRGNLDTNDTTEESVITKGNT